MSTEAQCVEATMAEVVEANVNLPLRILKHAKSRYIPCVVYRAALVGSVEAAMRGETRGGIFNVSSGDVHFLSFLEDRFGWRGEVAPAHSMGRAPNSQLDTQKAKEQNLITTC